MDGGFGLMPLSLIEPTKVEGCLKIVFKDFEDNRGIFSEAYQHDEFKSAGLPTEWLQDNISISAEGILRGLHIQRVKPQGKLVRCFRGAIYDVCLDLRENSPTFLKHHVQVVSSNVGLYCPPGTAHGFLALTHGTVVYYKCTSLWDAGSDGGIEAFDPEIDIPWQEAPVKGPLIRSAKDEKLPTMKEWLTMGEQK